MSNIYINGEPLTYNNILYVDSNNGNDSSGDGSIIKPYATIQKAIDSSIDGDAIYIKGTHFFEAGYWDDQSMGSHIYLPNHNLDFIGDGITSHIINTSTLPSSKLASLFCVPLTGGYIYNFIRLVLDSSEWNDIYGAPVIVSPQSDNLSDESNCTVKFINCAIKQFDISNRIGYLYLMNSATQVYRYYASINTILEIYNTASHNELSPNLQNVTFNENWNITSGNWQNAGTGINPDGTQAHIGVYGGPYAWGEWIIYRILADDNGEIKYYNPITKEWDITSLTANNFIKKGINSIDLLRHQDTISQTMADNGLLGEGKVFIQKLNLDLFETIDKIEVV